MSGNDRTKNLLKIVAVSGVLLFLFGKSAAFLLTDIWWFDTVGYQAVYLATLQVSVGIGVLCGGVTFITLIFVGNKALRSAPISGQPVISQLTGLPQQMPSDRQVRAILALGGLILSFMHGMWASTKWPVVLKFINQVSFDKADPILQHDISYYLFSIPFFDFLQTAARTIVMLSIITAAVIFSSRGAVGLQRKFVNGQTLVSGLTVNDSVRKIAAVLAACWLLTSAVGHLLIRYTLMHNGDGLIAGPTYADVYAKIPLQTASALTALVAAVLVSVGIYKNRNRILMTGVGAVIAAALVASVYPGLLQKLKVLPNEARMEAPFIGHHIAATRDAFGLSSFEERSLPGDAGLSRADIDANQGTIQNVRLWDHGPLLDTFSQLQEIRPYYNFVSVDNDRYMIDGELRQIMLSPREISADQLPEQAHTWVNETMTYTHGYGLTLGPVNEVTKEGLPTLFIKDLPPQIQYPDDLSITRPEIYFGESMDQPVFVNTNHEEFDYPTGEESQYTIYAGDGGLTMGSILSRALLSARLDDLMILLSNDLTNESKVLLYRDISTRVKRIAPFLKLDSNPYMALIDGRMVWILDAYTTSNRYPYSEKIGSFGNYLQNSVKVTVDAYDGAVSFYAIHPEEPILATWMQALPSLFKSADELPASVRAHLRVPEDLFAVQAHMFASYHMTDAQIFYNREDEWEVPVVDRRRMHPYYTVMKLPGEDTEEFILMLPFVPKNKPNLAAWMVARNDGEHYGETYVYKFPKDKMVYGPNMMVARINQNDKISEKLSLWNQRGSSVLLGTMLVIPVEESLIYIQPLYLRADDGSIPELKRVIVGYEEQIAMEPTLDGALATIFGDKNQNIALPETMPTTPNTPNTPNTAPVSTTTVSIAQQQLQAAEAAAQSGDWANYGKQLDQLRETLSTLLEETEASQE